jgi:hypothetical protein
MKKTLKHVFALADTTTNEAINAAGLTEILNDLRKEIAENPTHTFEIRKLQRDECGFLVF